jgi:hypothetical protein
MNAPKWVLCKEGARSLHIFAYCPLFLNLFFLPGVERPYVELAFP